MSIIELIPLDKGNRLVLDRTVVTTIGRTPNIGCVDKKISRNHAEIYVKPDGTVWIKPIHHNPTFFKTKTQQLMTLTKDEEFQLHNNDEIGLLPNEYFYRISIESADKQEDKAELPINSKSPIPERESSPSRESSLIDENPSSPVKLSNTEEPHAPVSNLEPEGGIIFHTTRSLPAWMSNSSTTEPKTPKGRGKGKSKVTPTKTTPSPSKYRTYIGRKKAECIVYENDDESSEEPTIADQAKQISKTAKRERCPYGKFCYRKNPIHRQENIHPGDPDWDNKENDEDDSNKPECPYGIDCYRKNPDHIKQFQHTQKPISNKKPKQRTSAKHKGSDDEEDDDDDGLPNEYDYNDSFIDDEDLNDSARLDRSGSSQQDPDRDWKPDKKAQRDKYDFDDEYNLSDDEELNLLKEEAADFVRSSSIREQRPAKKKARISMPDESD